MNHSNGEGWEQWGKHVLAELERQDRSDAEIRGLYNELIKVLIKQGIEIAALKVKAGVWGAIAGVIPAAGLLIYWLVKK